MRTLARWIGGLWLVAAFLAAMTVGFIEWQRPDHTGVIIPVRGGFGEVYILVALAVPGIVLLSWGEKKTNA